MNQASKSTRILWAAALLAGASWLGGCATTSEVGVSAAVSVDTAPPEPPVEVIVDAPSPDYVWVPGYWYWSGYDYVWVPGRYARPPAAGHVYIRSGWVYRGGRYHYAPGYWAGPRYQPTYRYVHRYPPTRYGPTYRTVPRSSPRPAPRPRR